MAHALHCKNASLVGQRRLAAPTREQCYIPRPACLVSGSSCRPTCLHSSQAPGLRSSSIFTVWAANAMEEAAVGAKEASDRSLICTSITAASVEAFLGEIKEATSTGVDLIELRLDFIKEFNPQQDLVRIMEACTIPYIVTYRPTWEGGNYDGPEPERLATLKYACIKGAPYVDVEYKASQLFFAGAGEVPVNTKLILSSHNFKETPPAAELHARAAAMQDAGADIVKIACFANDICDSAVVLSLLQQKTGPTIALAMGEKGQITRLLAAKYGGYLTFAAMSSERASAPGQPTIQQMQQLYSFSRQGPGTKLYGIIGNPVHHSKSPLIHNTAFREIGFDACYVPLLVDDLDNFLAAFKDHDFQGFSVTIPHKEAALRAAASSDPVAAQIGAVNTLVKQQQGDGRSFKGYNTDWLAAISAIERRLAGSSSSSGADGAPSSSSSSSSSSALQGKTLLVIGAGGAGKALAFGAASRGAKVLITNRNQERAEALAAAVPDGATVVPLGDVQQGKVAADVLANTTSVGMVPNVEETPVPAAAVGQFKLVFDAVYTPRDTQLLKDARAAGCLTVDGVEMFVGQAVEQFKLFTGCQDPPVALMEQVVAGGSK